MNIEMASQVDISKALPIGGWMSEDELTWLASQAKTHRFIVEFGSFHGRSARAIADNLPEYGKLWAVDPWSGDYIDTEGHTLKFTTYVMPHFVRNLNDHIAAGRVIPKRGYSYEFDLPFLVDMVFIDGDHRYETVRKDIRKAFTLLRVGGLICGHDYEHNGWPGVKQAVDELVGEVEVKDTIWSALKS